ncbi:LuxR C-terminal-related transcriptional regulator [Microbacterium sp. AZCO]|uniref:helix-turn-helix transcriptional regulator n=1 Tax=Microbacterium sp. AZCO TaxID=3142976 RepID=UPI0031F429D9
MGDSGFLRRWIELGADLLSAPAGDDPLVRICAELSVRFGASATGTIDYRPERARVSRYQSSRKGPLRYVARVADHPLVLHYRATTDPRARTLSEARRFLPDPWARALVDDLRADGYADFAFLPLRPRADMRHRWLALATPESFGRSVGDDLDSVAPLIRAIDGQRRALTTVVAPPEGVGLSARELAVLGLTARGLTAVAIGSQLVISPRTVTKHQQSVYRKLAVGDRLTAVLRAQELGILRPQGGRDGAHALTVAETAITPHAALRIAS